MAIDERWIFGHALHVENRQVGTFARSTLYSKLTLDEAQDNWLLAAVPAPGVSEGWGISAVNLRYTIRGRAGVIDKVGVRDGERVVHSFEGLSVWSNSQLADLKLAAISSGTISVRPRRLHPCKLSGQL
jgi:hypothetical protein